MTLKLPQQTVTMGDWNPTTTHMESKKGGRPDKVDKGLAKDGATSKQPTTDEAFSAELNDWAWRVTLVPVVIQQIGKTTTGVSLERIPWDRLLVSI